MNTIHDENKIRELIKKSMFNISIIHNSDDDKNKAQLLQESFIHQIEKMMKEYAEYIREKTIDECIACVPDKKHEAWTDHNDCREKTITNLNQLKNNG